MRKDRVAVMRTHPETGRKALFVNPAWTSHVCELAYAESEALLELLFAHAVLPEDTVRRRWSQGDGDEPRVIHRLTLQGETPA